MPQTLETAPVLDDAAEQRHAGAERHEELHARAVLRNLTEDVHSDHLDAVIALLRDFTGVLPARRAVYLLSVGDPAARMLVAEQFPELVYEVEGRRGEHGLGTVVHTWTCSGTGAFARYAQGPDGCTVTEYGGLLRRHIWDDLVGLFTAFDMTRPPRTDNDAAGPALP
ncbi:hypothetical protein [Amycolatopsis sp. cmx-4-61]|uniref:hypothetical protein n=1 Tax=Amycolatopsis sp. cmx-4-61 TaxID=2790937 RepID=UPI0039782D85